MGTLHTFVQTEEICIHDRDANSNQLNNDHFTTPLNVTINDDFCYVQNEVEGGRKCSFKGESPQNAF